ncbi:M28 family peptidase [Actinomadura gamaensis]|uniref:M28 family peptidase n=1 Tax=Actinomadura gamaensis TaxID=1763541 RepID=A0ABV9TVC9_9ACTN
MLRSRLLVLPAVAAVAVTTAAPGAAAPAPGGAIPGFTAAHSKWQQRYERLFGATPSGAVAKGLDADLSAEPALVGTDGLRRRTEKIVRYLRSYGLRPEVKTYYEYMSEPKSVQVEMTAPEHRTLPVKERPQPWQRNFDEVVVGYSALSPAGRVTAPVVYANYGRDEDYKVLAANGVSVKGKIVLVRYGGVFRGVKTRQAYLHGAKGLLIYSDPADDGFSLGKVYPEGPWRAPDGIQRGSVGQIMFYSGDPLTPGRPATRNAKRLPPSQAAELPKGPPTTPISYGAAEPLLRNLTGKPVPKEWQGGLPFTYRFGPGGTEAHLDLDIKYSVKPVYDVVVRIPGSRHPEQEVIVGGHHDSWTYGSDDNLTGTENVLQIGRGLAQMLRKGWRPDRTIVLATWDGEEYGLYGSTEYAEERAARLRNAVAYINMDVSAGQYFVPVAPPATDQLIVDAAKEVTWPGTGGSLYEAWKRQNNGTTPFLRVGGGSDYQAFFHHYGVPVMNLSAASPAHNANYHCTCDDHYWMSKFGDPTWQYHVAMTQLSGILALRLANADVIPLEYRPYAAQVAGYLDDFTKRQRDVLGKVVVDVQRDVVQAQAWQRAAQSLADRAEQALQRGDHAAFRQLNTKIMQAERDLLTSAGLPGRPWHRHQIYAPAMDTGYGPQALPGLNDALFLNSDPRTAGRYEALLFSSLQAATRTLTP